jgi:hypothetical protein
MLVLLTRDNQASTYLKDNLSRLSMLFIFFVNIFINNDNHQQSYEV